MCPSPQTPETSLVVQKDQSPAVIQPKDFANLSTLVAELRAAYDAADRTNLKAQKFAQMAMIPAMNELRYAGHHLLNGLTPHLPEETPVAELNRAINHCKRARYDASEAAILFAFDQIDTFKTDYRDVVISEVVPDWIAILMRCDEIRDALTNTRAKGEDRYQDHVQANGAFDELSTICKRLAVARQDLNQKRVQATTEARRFVWTLVLGILGILVAVVGALIAL